MNGSGELRPLAKRVWLTVAIVTLVIAIAGVLSWFASGVLVIFAGILFGVFLGKLSGLLAKVTGMSYRIALGVVAVLLVSGSFATIYFMGSRISQQVTEFSQQLENASNQLHSRLKAQGWYEPLGGLSSAGPQSLLPDNLMSTARQALITIIAVVGGMILVTFLGFYLALQSHLYRGGIARLFPPGWRPRTNEILDELTQTLWWWTLGRLVAMLLIGVGSGLGLWFIGIPLPVTQGVLAGLLNFVPNLGPLIASIPPILLALQQSPETALYVAGFYFTLQLIESYFITPLIDQQQVSLPPGLILSSQLLLGMMAGFLGLLLATPLTAVIYTLVHELYVKDTLESPRENL